MPFDALRSDSLNRGAIPDSSVSNPRGSFPQNVPWMQYTATTLACANVSPTPAIRWANSGDEGSAGGPDRSNRKAEVGRSRRYD